MAQNRVVLSTHSRARTDKRQPAAKSSGSKVQPGGQQAALQRALDDPGAASPAALHALQHSLGNRAVTQLVNRSAGAPLPIQAKLIVGPAGDAYEQEADHVASQVMSMSAPGTQEPAPAAAPPVQRAAGPADALQFSRADASAGFEAGADMEGQLAASKGGGSPLPERVRSFMEPRFGADFGSVRVHTGPQAVQLNRDVQAQAFTHGQDIYMGAGRYNPGTTAGNHLLAHELTHVVQQGGGGAPPRVQRLFGKKKKKTEPQPIDPENQAFEDTGEVPQSALFLVKAAVKTGTKLRGNASLSELLGGGGGHSWIELELGPGFADMEEFRKEAVDGDMVADVMEATTYSELNKNRRTTIGFYPRLTGRPSNFFRAAKQIFKNYPGQILEPEGQAFAGKERGAKSYVITDPAKAIQLLAFVNAHRSHYYNVHRYNCTDFVVNALQSIGLSLGKTSNAGGATLPTLLYKQIFKRAELGDKTATYTGLEKKKNRKGKKYDFKHVPKRTQKRLEKQKSAPGFKRAREARMAARLWSRTLDRHVVTYLLELAGGGYIRPGEEIGATGVVQDTWGEVVYGSSAEGSGDLGRVDLEQYETMTGAPYPGAPSQPEQAPTDITGETLVEDKPNLVNEQGETGLDQLADQDEQDVPGGLDGSLAGYQPPPPGSVVTLVNPLKVVIRLQYSQGEAHEEVAPAGTKMLIFSLTADGVAVEAAGVGRGTAALADLRDALGETEEPVEEQVDDLVLDLNEYAEMGETGGGFDLLDNE